MSAAPRTAAATCCARVVLAPARAFAEMFFGAAIAPAVQVAVQDAQGNTVTTATTSITQ